MTENGERRAALVVVAAGMCLVFVASGRYGFDFTDAGFVLADAKRLLAGDVPHVDVFSPRPLGAALLHVVDFLLPTPLFLTSRVITLAEMIAYSGLFARLSYRRSIRTWNAWHVLGFALATFINMHTFPFMTWYTTDGLLVVALTATAGAKWRRTLSPAWLLSTCVLAGYASVIKQSFAPLALAVVVAVAYDVRRRESRTRAIAVAIAGVAGPGALYGIWVAGNGGLSKMATQLTSGGAVSGRTVLFPSNFDDHGVRILVVVITCLAGLIAVWHHIETTVRQVGALCFAALVVALPFSRHLSLFGSWGSELFWVAVVIVAAVSIQQGAIARRDVFVLFVAWMATLSWGYAVPDLVGGTLALHSIAIVFRRVPWTIDRRLMHPAAVVACAAIVPFALRTTADRRANVYRDRTASHLTRDLGAVAEAGRGIRTDPVVADFTAAIAGCAHLLGTRRIALVPDGPAAYPLLDLDNPLPADWPIDEERGGKSRQLTAEVEGLRGTGAVVLLETFPAARLPDLAGLPTAALSDPPVASSTTSTLLEVFGSPTETCGPFLVLRP